MMTLSWHQHCATSVGVTKWFLLHHHKFSISKACIQPIRLSNFEMSKIAFYQKNHATHTEAHGASWYNYYKPGRTVSVNKNHSHIKIQHTVGLVFLYGFYFHKLTCIRKLNPHENFCTILYACVPHYMKIKFKRKFKIRNIKQSKFPFLW